MARNAVINSTGVYIARRGFDALTASGQNILFSSKAAQQRIQEQGIIVCGGSDDRYKVGSQAFSKTYTRPPIIYLAGMVDANISDICTVTLMGIVGQGPVYWQVEPYYSAQISLTGFTLKVWTNILPGMEAFNWRYIVMENTL